MAWYLQYKVPGSMKELQYTTLSSSPSMKQPYSMKLPPLQSHLLIRRAIVSANKRAIEH